MHYSSFIRLSLCSALVVGVLAPVGCKLTHGDTTVEVLPADEPEIPPDATPVGEFVDPLGNVYKLWDVNGDGKPDLAEAADGTLKWVKPVAPANPGDGFTSVPPSGPSMTVSQQLAIRGKYVLLTKQPDDPVDIDFQLTAEQYLQSTGLDQLGSTSSVALYNTLEPLAFDESDMVDLEAMDMDFLVHLAPEFGVPSMWDHPGLKHQARWLLDASGSPAFMTVQVQGPPSQALAFLAKLNYSQGGGSYALDSNPGFVGYFHFAIDHDLAVATVDVDGTIVQVPLHDPAAQ